MWNLRKGLSVVDLKEQVHDDFYGGTKEAEVALAERCSLLRQHRRKTEHATEDQSDDGSDGIFGV